MSKILLVLICCVVFLKSPAQTVQTYIRSHEYTVCNHAVTVGSSTFIVKDSIDLFSNYGNSPEIIKLNQKLEIIDSIDIPAYFNIDTTSWALSLDTGNNGQLYFLFNHSENTPPYNYHPLLVILDTSLHVLDTITVPFNNDSLSFTPYKTTYFEPNYFLTGSQRFSPTETEGLITQLDSHGNLLKVGFVPDSTIYTPGSDFIYLIDLIKHQNKFICSLYPNYSKWEQIAVFDTTLNLLKTDLVTDSTKHIAGVTQLINVPNHPPKLITLTLHDLKIPLPPPGFGSWQANISLYTMTPTYSFAALDTFAFVQNREDTVDFFARRLFRGNVAQNNTADSVLVASTDFNIQALGYHTKLVTNTYVYSINAVNRSLNWRKIYNNGYSHSVREVVRLPGNRHALIMNEYNWDKYPGESLGIHIIIINENGNPIGINEDEEIGLNTAPVIYPIPAKDAIIVTQLYWPGNTYRYYINDLTGRTVQQGELVQDVPIPLNGNLRGLYSLNIVNQTGFGWARKIVIE